MENARAGNAGKDVTGSRPALLRGGLTAVLALAVAMPLVGPLGGAHRGDGFGFQSPAWAPTAWAVGLSLMGLTAFWRSTRMPQAVGILVAAAGAVVAMFLLILIGPLVMLAIHLPHSGRGPSGTGPPSEEFTAVTGVAALVMLALLLALPVLGARRAARHRTPGRDRPVPDTSGPAPRPTGGARSRRRSRAARSVRSADHVA